MLHSNHSDDAILLEVKDDIGHIIFNRPEQSNHIDDAFIDALERVTCTCADDRSIRAILISARGERFSVGGDIGGFTESREDLPRKLREWNASLNGSVARLHRGRAPTVAAVHGVVAGGALSIISGCDIIVAATSARFVSAYATIGYCPDLGGTVNLARRIGLARAKRFHLLHERLDAASAEKIGLVDLLVPRESVFQEAEAIARKWAAGPTGAYGEIRKLMHQAYSASLEDQLEAETRGIVEMSRSEDAWEALTAFLAKRNPEYKGQ